MNVNPKDLQIEALRKRLEGGAGQAKIKDEGAEEDGE